MDRLVFKGGATATIPAPIKRLHRSWTITLALLRSNRCLRNLVLNSFNLMTSEVSPLMLDSLFKDRLDQSVPLGTIVATQKCRGPDRCPEGSLHHQRLVMLHRNTRHIHLMAHLLPFFTKARHLWEAMAHPPTGLRTLIMEVSLRFLLMVRRWVGLHHHPISHHHQATTVELRRQTATAGQ